MSARTAPRGLRRLALALAGVALLSAGCGTTYNRVENPTLQLPTTTTAVRLPHGARPAIDRTLRAFVIHAVSRHDPAAAFDLATPSMRAGGTRADWRSGNLPVPPFAARASSATKYSVMSASAGDANLRLLLQPLHPRRDGVIAYQVHVKQVGGRWLVDWFTPVAFFAPAGSTPAITAEPDLSPSAHPHLAGQSSGSGAVAWGLIALLTTPAVFVVGTLIVLAVRGRRRRQLDDAGWREALTASRDR